MTHSAQNVSRLCVCVHPGKKVNRLYAIDGEIHIDLEARAIEGQANKYLLRFLGKILSLPPSLLSIHRGISSRYKEIVFPISEDELSERAKNLFSDG